MKAIAILLSLIMVFFNWYNIINGRNLLVVVFSGAMFLLNIIVMILVFMIPVDKGR